MINALSDCHCAANHFDDSAQLWIVPSDTLTAATIVLVGTVWAHNLTCISFVQMEQSGYPTSQLSVHMCPLGYSSGQNNV